MSKSFGGGEAFARALSGRLSDLRVASSTSQVTIAAELGVDQGVISRVEAGYRRLGVGEAYAWFEALGLTAEEASTELCSLWTTFGKRPPGFWDNDSSKTI